VIAPLDEAVGPLHPNRFPLNIQPIVRDRHKRPALHEGSPDVSILDRRAQILITRFTGAQQAHQR
jgi:hypothetical protein